MSQIIKAAGMEEGNSRLYDIRIGVKETNHGLGETAGPIGKRSRMPVPRSRYRLPGISLPVPASRAIVLGRDSCQGAGNGSGREHGKHVVFAGNTHCGCRVYPQTVGD